MLLIFLFNHNIKTYKIKCIILYISKSSLNKKKSVLHIIFILIYGIFFYTHIHMYIHVLLYVIYYIHVSFFTKLGNLCIMSMCFISKIIQVIRDYLSLSVVQVDCEFADSSSWVNYVIFVRTCTGTRVITEISVEVSW